MHRRTLARAQEYESGRASGVAVRFDVLGFHLVHVRVAGAERSILRPIVVGNGMSIATIARAPLASTFATSVVGATYALLPRTTTGGVAPHWALGLTCGAGGRLGGYLGADSNRG